MRRDGIEHHGKGGQVMKTVMTFRFSFRKMQRINSADGEGFEPPVPFGHTRFPGVRIRPLCHPSITAKGIERMSHSPGMFKEELVFIEDWARLRSCANDIPKLIVRDSLL